MATNRRSPHSAVAIEIGADVLLETTDDVAQERRELVDFILELSDTRFEGRGALAMLGELALLIEIPEEAHVTVG